MNIIKVDREIIAQKEFRETTGLEKPTGKKKRMSAVTMAKLLQKQQIQQLLSDNSSGKDQNSNIGVVLPQYRSPQGKKSTKRSSPNSKNMARRSLQFGSSSASSPRSASRLSGVRTSKIRKSGVKAIVHTKPWK